MEPKVSIIINNYNYGCYIRYAIESALAQTYHNTEIIVVDDGSTDESRNIIAQYNKKCKIFLKNNGGQASAFNIGISEATGEYIILLDSDDYLYPEVINVCLKEYNDSYSRIFFKLDLIDKNNKLIKRRRKESELESFNGNFFKEIVEKSIFAVVPTSGNFFNASILKKVLPIPEKEFRICADIFIFVKTAHHGPVKLINRKLGAYRIHDSNNFCLKANVKDKKRLQNQVENIFKNKKLIEEGCKKEGFKYEFNIIQKNFVIINTLIAAFKTNIDISYIKKLNKKELIMLAIQFLYSGEGNSVKRFFQFLYLLTVIFTTKFYSVILIQIMHRWMNR